MAKKTKEKTLEDALVPEEEQPYEIPENWVWTRLGELIFEIRNGTTIKQNKSGRGYFVTRIESLQNQTIDFDRLGNIENENEIRDIDWYQAGDIVMSHINSAKHVGKTALIKEEMLPLVHGMNLVRLRFKKIFSSELFQLYSQSYGYKALINEKIKMAVNQVSINQKQICSIYIPLPPLPEQRRIVDRIEDLFQRLDRAKELTEEVLESFEQRKAAILHKAFTGELTEGWRKERGIRLEKPGEDSIAEEEQPYKIPENWTWAKLGDVSEINMGQSPPGKDTTEDPSYTPLVGGASDMGDIFPNPSRYTKAPKKLSKKGDLIICIRATLGKPVYSDKEYCLGRGVAGITPILVQSKFLKYFFMNSGKYLLDNATGSTFLQVKKATLNKMPISLPPFPEQKEIVRILDSLLERERQAEEQVEEVLEEIELMKKAILARAFRGELGTNDPTEESAKELLKSIL